MIPGQMLKGNLEDCVLTIISMKETYGYEIVQKLEEFGFGNIAEGTVYPLLLRLEKQGFVETEIRASDYGPKRKYYRITSEGKREILSFIASFRELAEAVENLMLEVARNEQTD